MGLAVRIGLVIMVAGLAYKYVPDGKATSFLANMTQIVDTEFERLKSFHL
jgi:hypothetical protein